MMMLLNRRSDVRRYQHRKDKRLNKGNNQLNHVHEKREGDNC